MNARWTYGDLLFVTLHRVGSEIIWDTADMDAEYSERNAVDLNWTRESPLGKIN